MDRPEEFLCYIRVGFVRRVAIRDEKARINRRIRVPQVRLIDEQGQQVGVVPTFQALEMAEERGLDLVEVAPNADPPVARLMDYGKFLYDQAKKEREARKNQKVVEVRQIKVEPNTHEYHLELKGKQARRFLEEGNKVKFIVKFRGRQLAHTDIGTKMLQDIGEALRDIAVIEQQPQQEGKTQSMLLAPAPKSSKRSERASQSNAAAPAEEPEVIKG